MPGQRLKKALRDGKPVGDIVCGGTKRNGDPCLREKGWGTDHVGRGRCRHHGGASVSGATGAAREEMNAMARPILDTAFGPADAVMGVLRLASGQLAYATVQVGEADSILDTDGHLIPWYRIQRDQMDRVVKYASAAAAMGVAERQVNLAEAQTEMMGELLEAVMAEVGLTPAQRKKVGPAIRTHLTLVEGTAREKVAA